MNDEKTTQEIPAAKPAASGPPKFESHDELVAWAFLASGVAASSHHLPAHAIAAKADALLAEMNKRRETDEERRARRDREASEIPQG